MNGVFSKTNLINKTQHLSFVRDPNSTSSTKPPTNKHVLANTKEAMKMGSTSITIQTHVGLSKNLLNMFKCYCCVQNRKHPHIELES